MTTEHEISQVKWMRWDGKSHEPPVPHHTFVAVRLRSGHEEVGSAGVFQWNHVYLAGDIIWWRLAGKADVAATQPSVAGIAQQPAPQANQHPAVWPLVLKDMALRDEEGRKKYGVPLQPHNGRDALTDAYQEALDLAVYLRTAIYERDGK